MEKEKALIELYALIDYFYEFRDLPVEDPNFNFDDELSKYCKVLEVDEKKVKEMFKLNYS